MQMKIPVSGGLISQRCLALFLAFLVTFQPSAFGQAAAVQEAKPAANLPQIQSLRVAVLAGNNESNNMETRTMAPLVVQVLDREARPVEGADVTFRFPASGPSAIFANGERSQIFRTNSDGQVAATGWMATGLGRFQVKVTANRRGETGEATVSMTNADRVAPPVKKEKHWYSSGWFKAALIAGAAGAVTGIVLTQTGGNGSAPPVTISVGSPTIGGGPQ